MVPWSYESDQHFEPCWHRQPKNVIQSKRKIPWLWLLTKTKTGANWLLKTRQNLYKAGKEQNNSCSTAVTWGWNMEVCAQNCIPQYPEPGWSPGDLCWTLTSTHELGIQGAGNIHPREIKFSKQRGAGGTLQFNFPEFCPSSPFPEVILQGKSEMLSGENLCKQHFKLISQSSAR